MRVVFEAIFELAMSTIMLSVGVGCICAVILIIRGTYRTVRGSNER